MVLESTFFCVDNSEYMRNGDFLPTRLQAQQDAVGMVIQTKLRSNPESDVGMLSLCSLDVLLTLTTDTGKALAKLHSIQPKGKINFIPAIKIAHLALKHRIGKNHKTRIVAFIGSPILSEEKELIKLAKKLKKEKVNVDLVSFGETEANAELLKKFIETVNPKDGTGSNLVTIPAGPHLTDALVSSPVVQSESGALPSVVPNGGGGFEFGFDPNDDPELALALRVSMEENRARQTQEANADTPAENVPTTGAEISGAPEDEAMLERALEMSNQKGEQKIEEQTGLATMTEEQQIEYAMKMSMQTGDETDDESKEKMDVDPSDKDKSSTTGENKKDEDYSEVINDPEFLQSVLESLPGVDPHSDAMQQAMAALTGSSKKEEADSEKKDNEDEK